MSLILITRLALVVDDSTPIVHITTLIVGSGKLNVQPGTSNDHLARMNVQLGTLNVEYAELNVQDGTLNVRCGTMNDHSATLIDESGTLNNQITIYNQVYRHKKSPLIKEAF